MSVKKENEKIYELYVRVLKHYDEQISDYKQLIAYTKHSKQLKRHYESLDILKESRQEALLEYNLAIEKMGMQPLA